MENILVVCYAGADTKLIKNSGKAPFKRTQIDRLLNRIILGVGNSFNSFFEINILFK
jgi:hypothetical protein